MRITQNFDYHRPQSVREVIDLLKQIPESAYILAGGTDLIVQLKEDLIRASALIDIKDIQELQRLEITDDELWIGATVTFNRLIEDSSVMERFPVVIEMAKTVGSAGLRNRATLVGNICSAVPSMDSASILLVYNAEVVVQSDTGQRIIPVSRWFVAPRKTALAGNEVVVGVKLSRPAQPHAACYLKLQRYRGEDLAQVGVAVLALQPSTWHVAWNAVGPVPTRSEKIEAVLNGNQLTPSVIESARKLIPEEISPISDIRASEKYRMQLAGVMLERCLKAAADRLNGNGPEYGARLV